MAFSHTYLPYLAAYDFFEQNLRQTFLELFRYSLGHLAGR